MAGNSGLVLWPVLIYLNLWDKTRGDLLLKKSKLLQGKVLWLFRNSIVVTPPPPGGGGGYSTKFYMGRLRPELQTLILLCTIFDRKGTPLHTSHRKWYPFHIPSWGFKIFCPFNFKYLNGSFPYAFPYLNS